MKSRFIISLAAALLAGCATNANGPAFNSQTDPTAPTGYARVYVFRDKVLYLAQAPYAVRTQIAIDGRIVGRLTNGGYLVTNVAAGQHAIAAGSGEYQTIRPFNAASSGDGYIEITDKTRMEGARMLAEGAVGALAARGNAIQAAEGRRETKQDEFSGAMDAISQDEFFSGPERVWDIEFPIQSDALRKLTALSRSD